jgi:hypothetical protein
MSEAEQEKILYLETPLAAVLYLMQGKSVIKTSVPGEITDISRHRIGILCQQGQMKEFELYQDMEIVVGDENAYAKIMEIEENSLNLHFTFLSEHFMEVCGYGKREG